MKLTCKTAILREALGTVLRAAPSTPIVPITSNVLVSARKDGVTLTCTDTAMSIRYLIDCRDRTQCEVISEGSVALPAKLLSETLRHMPGAEVSISVSATNSTSIKCGDAKVMLSGLDAQQFPSLPEVSPTATMSVPQGALRRLLEQTYQCASAGDTNPVLESCLLELSENELRAVTVNGCAVALNKINMQRGAFAAILPRVATGEIIHALRTDDDGQAELRVDAGTLYMNVGATTVIAKLPSGQYPDYKRIIDRVKTSIHAQVRVDDMLRAIELSRLMSLENGKSSGQRNLVLIDVDEQTVEIHAAASTASAAYSVQTECDGQISIAFNASLLAGVLKSISDEQVILGFNDPTSPCTIRPVRGDAHFHLVLPVRVRQA